MISQKQEILFFGDSLATMERGIKEVRSVICRRADLSSGIFAQKMHKNSSIKTGGYSLF